MPTFDRVTTAEQAAEVLSQQTTGKNVLITGATLGGLGAETARVIAKYASLVFLAGRSPAKLDETIRSIKNEIPSANLRPIILDLSSLAGAREGAAAVNAHPENIHVLINNAAIMASPYTLTVDGFESQIGINHFAHFLFTALIFNKIASAGTKSDPARIVNVSGGAHQASGIRFDDMNFSDGKVYDRWAAYGQSKTANILFSNEISRRALEHGVPVVSYSLHPGVIGDTGLSRYMSEADLIGLGAKNKKGEWVGTKTVGEGAATSVVAAFDPSILSQPGAYLVDSNIKEAQKAPHARSRDAGERLWALSESKVGEKFEI